MKVVLFRMPYAPGKLGVVIDPNAVPVAIVLSQQDRANIAAMDPDATVYFVYPKVFDVRVAERFVVDVKDQVTP